MIFFLFYKYFVFKGLVLVKFDISLIEYELLMGKKKRIERKVIIFVYRICIVFVMVFFLL